MLERMKGILQNLYTLQHLDAAPQTATATQVASLRAGIPSGMLAHYDRVRARGKKGIALVRNHVCTIAGCRCR
jgi:predicted  nucleic acid-binding Zn-ribbon protein